jgi:hypothetical protein
MNKYEVIICRGDEDEAFVAQVPELPGCAAHGLLSARSSAGEHAGAFCTERNEV